MTDDVLRALATEAGLSSSWTDAFGTERRVSVETLRSVLSALGFRTETEGAIADARASLVAGRVGLPPLLTADAGGTLKVGGASDGAPWTITMEDARRIDGRLGADGALPVPDRPGYHLLALGGEECILAIAPARCFTIPDALAAAGRAPSSRIWGLSAQLYALRRANDGGLGDVGSLASFARSAAGHGADALSISPVHAQFSADPDRFSPYAPSSRVQRNVLHAAIDLDGAEASALEAETLVDWPRAGRLRLLALRHEWEARGRTDPAFARWRADADESVELHARFEALHAHHYDGGRGPWHWREWPTPFRDHESSAVASFARDHADAVAFHAWSQFRIEAGLNDAQAAARTAGMAIGLVADLAVGTDDGGSHCWSRPDETMMGLTIGAPPDLLSRDGQNWGITAFSPRGLAAQGFRAFIEMVRSALRAAGGVRIDHAMGLNRLWVVPGGAPSSMGTYLAMPERDLLRLLRLESHRHRAIVLAEDLGTVPEGFSDKLRAAGIDGMKVLWFERDAEKRFSPPAEWPRTASAMTSTHDLPTVSGWWRGRDIEWNAKIGRDTGSAAAERGEDRHALWNAFKSAGTASGEAPAEWDGQPVADAAASFLGQTACELVMLPVEDALALEEAPNLPGTTDEHPNWRRRFDGDAATLLDTDHVARRLALLSVARGGGD